MIHKILTYYVRRLDEYSGRIHRQPEGVGTVELDRYGCGRDPEKLVVSLMNLDKEATGDSVYMRSSSGNYTGTLAPLLSTTEHAMLSGARYLYGIQTYGDGAEVNSCSTRQSVQWRPSVPSERLTMS